MKLLYTQQTLPDLQRVRDFIAADNPQAAAKVSVRLRQAVQRLVDFPLLDKSVKIDSPSISLRDLITGRYLIRYAVLNQEIHILRIWHTREQR